MFIKFLNDKKIGLMILEDRSIDSCSKGYVRKFINKTKII